MSASAAIVIQFNHAMPPVMQTDAALHEGDITGPVVTCNATWSGDSTTLTLTPSTMRKAATKHTLHGGGAMPDADGNSVDLTQHGLMMGGQWATQQMVTGGGMMNGGGAEMGPGWRGTNGRYGMAFSFTTS